jgi:hypothetical protein
MLSINKKKITLQNDSFSSQGQGRAALNLICLYVCRWAIKFIDELKLLLPCACVSHIGVGVQTDRIYTGTRVRKLSFCVHLPQMSAARHMQGTNVPV